ncbi:hypothetical protein GCM10007989_01930 [Devosia pacifica]|uniref:Uncharacterized protein n=1 Tax=Devosia pacifica TaxID=1335967 RepID=A0A918RSK5_9HYPH|nr:hypothetical protein [Devosia pacifica]GHA11234.1 hypothetical protein GCM10007989_01930 [Devosia pacifica]
MSQDTIELVKVLLVTALIMLVGTLALFYLLLGIATFGQDLPVIGDLAPYAPTDMIPQLVDMRPFVVVGAVFLVVCGLTLMLSSLTLDMATALFAKAAAMLLAAHFGIFAGTWLFVRLSSGNELSIASLNRPGIALLAFFAFATIFRNAALRGLGAMRFAIAVLLILLGPVVLVSL